MPVHIFASALSAPLDSKFSESSDENFPCPSFALHPYIEYYLDSTDTTEKLKVWGLGEYLYSLFSANWLKARSRMC